MTTLAYTAHDTTVMFRRSIRRLIRYPSMTLMLVGMPIVCLLLFVYVFGGTLGAGLGSGAGGRAEYVTYLAPGIIVMTIAAAVQGTAISVAMDMTAGIINRFKTMAIGRSAVITGHVLASVAQTLVGVLVVLAVAIGIGFRPDAIPLEWLAALGILLAFTLALTWLAVALGLSAKSVETASNSPMVLMLLPFLGSGFVPTDSLPTALRWFAEYQPFTPVIESIRVLLVGGEIGNNAIFALGWSAIIGVAGYLWARALFARPRAQ